MPESHSHDDVRTLLHRLRLELEHADPVKVRVEVRAEEIDAFAAGHGEPAELDAIWRRIVADRAALEALGWACHAIATRAAADGRSGRVVAKRAMQIAIRRGTLAPRRRGRRLWFGSAGLAAVAAVIALFALLGDAPAPRWGFAAFAVDPVRGRTPAMVPTVEFQVGVSTHRERRVLLLLARNDGRRLVVEELFTGSVSGSGSMVRLPAPTHPYRFPSVGAVGLFLITRDHEEFSDADRMQAARALRTALGRARFDAGDCARAAAALRAYGRYSDWRLRAP